MLLLESVSSYHDIVGYVLCYVSQWEGNLELEFIHTFDCVVNNLHCMSIFIRWDSFIIVQHFFKIPWQVIVGEYRVCQVVRVSHYTLISGDDLANMGASGM